MRVKGIRFEQVLLALMLLAALCWNLANASEIKQLRVETGATGTRVELQLDRPGDYKVIELRNPDRLVVDFADSRLARNLTLPAGAGAVKAVRTGQPQSGTVRVVFDLANQVKAMPPRLETTATGPRLVLEWPGDAVATAPVTAVAVVPAIAPAKPDPIAEIAKASAAVESDPGKRVG